MSLLKLSNQHAASFLDGLNLKLGGAGHSCLPLQARILIKAETGASCRNHEPKGILKSFSNKRELLFTSTSSKRLCQKKKTLAENFMVYRYLIPLG